VGVATRALCGEVLLSFLASRAAIDECWASCGWSLSGEEENRPFGETLLRVAAEASLAACVLWSHSEALAAREAESEEEDAALAELPAAGVPLVGAASRSLLLPGSLTGVSLEVAACDGLDAGLPDTVDSKSARKAEKAPTASLSSLLSPSSFGGGRTTEKDSGFSTTGATIFFSGLGDRSLKYSLVDLLLWSIFPTDLEGERLPYGAICAQIRLVLRRGSRFRSRT
jgi:hypothetical protein